MDKLIKIRVTNLGTTLQDPDVDVTMNLYTGRTVDDITTPVTKYVTSEFSYNEGTLTSEKLRELLARDTDGVMVRVPGAHSYWKLTVACSVCWESPKEIIGQIS